MLKLNKEKINAMLILRGWNKSDLSRALGTSREWAGQLTRGKKDKDVRLSTIQKIADVLGFAKAKDLISE